MAAGHHHHVTGAEQPRVGLRGFGPPEIVLPGREVPSELTWRKHLGLLFYLARSTEGVRRRDHLTFLLWPDKDDTRARHSLNEACRAIRRALGDEALETRGDRIALDLARIDADWLAAERVLTGSDGAAIADLWRGDFLEGFGIDDAPAFEDWLAAERRDWRRRFGEKLIALARAALERGRYPEAAVLSARVLRADPLSEAAVRVAMTADALAGAAPAALERFADYKARLAADEHASAAADIAALAERIRAGHRATARTSSAPAPPPLVGRGTALAAVEPWLPAHAPRAAMVLVTGGAGSGRTRLVCDVAERARLAGARVVRVTCVAADAEAPGAALATLLDHGLAACAGFAATGPEALAILAALAAEVRQRFPGVRPAGDIGAAALGRAVGDAVIAVAAEGPLALVLDDVHLADERTLEALPGLLRGASDAAATFFLTARTDEPLPEPLVALRARIGHDVPGLEVALGPLGDADVAELVARALPALDEPARARLVRRLHEEGGGVPLFVIEILRALAAQPGGAVAWPAPGLTTAAPLPFPVPGAVVAALTLRVRSLGDTARCVLSAAAVAGTRPDPAMVAALRGLARPQADAALDDLVRAGFLREEDGVIVFTADLLRGAIESEFLTGSERRHLHRAAAEHLAAQGRGDGFGAARHRYAAGEWAAAAAGARSAAVAADAAGSVALARRARRLEQRALDRQREAEA